MFDIGFSPKPLLPRDSYGSPYQCKNCPGSTHSIARRGLLGKGVGGNRNDGTEIDSTWSWFRKGFPNLEFSGYVGGGIFTHFID